MFIPLIRQYLYFHIHIGLIIDKILEQNVHFESLLILRWFLSSHKWFSQRSFSSLIQLHSWVNFCNPVGDCSTRIVDEEQVAEQGSKPLTSFDKEGQNICWDMEKVGLVVQGTRRQVEKTRILSPRHLSLEIQNNSYPQQFEVEWGRWDWY